MSVLCRFICHHIPRAATTCHFAGFQGVSFVLHELNADESGPLLVVTVHTWCESYMLPGY